MAEHSCSRCGGPRGPRLNGLCEWCQKLGAHCWVCGTDRNADVGVCDSCREMFRTKVGPFYDDERRDTMHQKFDVTDYRAALKKIEGAYVTYLTKRRALEDQNLGRDARARELAKLEETRETEVMAGRKALEDKARADLEQASQPRPRRLSGDGWQELAYRTAELHRDIDNAAPDGAFELAKQHLATAPEWARSELVRIARPKVASGGGARAVEFSRLARSYRTDAEREYDAGRARARTVVNNLGWIEHYVRDLDGRVTRGGGEPDDVRLLDLWLNRVSKQADQAAEAATDDEPTFLGRTQ